jgi:hypothetical protein
MEQRKVADAALGLRPVCRAIRIQPALVDYLVLSHVQLKATEVCLTLWAPSGPSISACD